jgi:hypothetical protein
VKLKCTYCNGCCKQFNSYYSPDGIELDSVQQYHYCAFCDRLYSRTGVGIVSVVVDNIKDLPKGLRFKIH